MPAGHRRPSPCALFPAANVWKRNISSPPSPRSEACITRIGRQTAVYAELGSSKKLGIPYVVVPAPHPPVKTKAIAFPEESDPGPGVR